MYLKRKRELKYSCLEGIEQDEIEMNTWCILLLLGEILTTGLLLLRFGLSLFLVCFSFCSRYRFTWPDCVFMSGTT